MAPRTGADGLIASIAKTASTGISLVLAVAAALAVSGCGGDSASPETGSAPRVGTAKTTSEITQEKPSPEPGKPTQKSSPTSPATAPAGAGPEGAPGSGKQGSNIAIPKGPRERAPSARERAEATVVSMSLKSPALEPGPESVSSLPAAYSCDGSDTWPDLEWAGVPAGTAELALTVLSIEPVDEALFFNWALTGLDPSLQGLRSGELPKGAVVGRNSFGKNGYSICPPKGQETYIFTLYALPESIPARKGFDPLALRKQILDISGNAGLLAAAYTRR